MRPTRRALLASLLLLPAARALAQSALPEGEALRQALALAGRGNFDEAEARVAFDDGGVGGLGGELDDGVTELLGAADAILADVRAKRDTRKWQEGFIEAPLVYLNNRRWEDGTDSGGDEGVAEWFTTGGGIKAKGAELGVPYTAEDDCHPFDRYKARVFAKAGHSPRAAA